jgi:hypothetical protein
VGEIELKINALIEGCSTSSRCAPPISGGTGPSRHRHVRCLGWASPPPNALVASAVIHVGRGGYAPPVADLAAPQRQKAAFVLALVEQGEEQGEEQAGVLEGGDEAGVAPRRVPSPPTLLIEHGSEGGSEGGSTGEEEEDQMTEHVRMLELEGGRLLLPMEVSPRSCVSFAVCGSPHTPPPATPSLWH